MGNKSSHAATGSEKAALTKLLTRQSALSPDQFALASVGHHGVPSNAKAMAFCGMQGILAVGTASGTIKFYGKENVEMLLDAPPRSQTNLTIGVSFMKFTAHQRLVVAYTDSSLRIFDLENGGKVHTEIRAAWTTSFITCIETVTYVNVPFFFVATDDGDIHVMHEDTGRVSTYVISPRDVGVSSTEATRHTQFPTTMVSHPRDANQLLLAYDASSSVYLWDFAKRKVVREFTLAKPTKLKAGSPLSRASSTYSMAESEGDGGVNSPQTLSWHSSGKRFAVGYKYGGFAAFRADKSHGFYHTPVLNGGDDENGHEISAIKQIHWVSAPPNSKNAHLPGAIVFSGGIKISGASSKHALTLVCPPQGVSSEDAISDFVKSEQLTWCVSSIPSVNQAEIVAFAVAQDQVDYCAKIAPLSMVVLSGNPLDGCLPVVSVQPLPCFIRFREGDKEDWEWQLDEHRFPPPCVIPPLVQLSPLTTFSIVNLTGTDSALQDDLFTTWDQEKHDPLFRLLASDDFEWPINGGSAVEPLLHRFFSSSNAINDTSNDESTQRIVQSGTMMVTGHQNGNVMFWDVIPPADRGSKGTLHLLHVMRVPVATATAKNEVSCLSFCQDSRLLTVGFATGEIAVLEFGHQWAEEKPSSSLQNSNIATADDDTDPEGKSQDPSPVEHQNKSASAGFKMLFSLHIHSQSIKAMSVSSAYGYIAATDTGGVVSLIEIASQSYKLLIIDLAPSSSGAIEDEAVSVDSLLMSELVQVTNLPSSLPSAKKSPTRPNRSLSRSSMGDKNDDALVHREVVPVLFVGRGNGKLEMFHVESGTKMAESLADPQKASSLSSILMVDADGKRIDIPGRVWADKEDELADSAVAASTGEQQLTTAEVGDAKAWNPEMMEHTRQILDDVLVERSTTVSSTDVVVVDNEEPQFGADMSKTEWVSTKPVQVSVSGGSLGLHLFTDVEQHAVVKAFVSESVNAGWIASKGVHAGHVITSINGVDLTAYSRDVICGLLEKLRDHDKVIVFAEGFSFTSSEQAMAVVPANKNETGVANLQLMDRVEDNGARFLVCTCGKSIHLLQAAMPRASEMASGPKEMFARPLASVEVPALILSTSVIRVPVSENLEHCLVVIDQSNHVYVISLLGLEILWEYDCFSLGNALDGIRFEVAYSGELVVANSFGEVERFSLFAEHTASENALLARKCIQTKVHLPERMYPFEGKDQSNDSSPKKKNGLSMFKKLVTGLKDVVDLNKVFQFSKEDDDRERLLGDRASVAAKQAAAEEQDPNGTKKTSKGISDTKNALMQATQHLNERGEKLSDLALKTEQMKQTSEDFYHTMKAFNEKNANKKWYEF
uniref:V-SNARE coiled-coil homology domain-containing protein n=1 Tax=Globisporangium ultimum (strain ATCC 200006 / CBS 805.95 / DAOM BR144) TaxID=431595 RepID=K3X4W1_GLOUD